MTQNVPRNGLRLLALDGGGVRGLSSLMILKQLMSAVDPNSPPKPCDYFDMIGGTSTGGLIAIMLGRLRMSVDECIDAYASLSDKVFRKRRRGWISFKGQLRGRFDAAKLEGAIKEILRSRGLDENMLLKDSSPASACKVFVCATSKETSDTICLTSYRSPRGGERLFDNTKLWEACRATSAATSFFDPIAVGQFGEEFVDGGFGANNPVFKLWEQAQDLWPNDLQAKLKCLVSIGTGLRSVKPVRDDVGGLLGTLRRLATETEKTAEQFCRDKSKMNDEGRYYRFNVVGGLETVGLEESKKMKEIAAMTERYITSESVFKQMKTCAGNLAGRGYYGPYRIDFNLRGVPVSAKFIERPSDLVDIEKCLLPPTRSRQGRRIFVLHGLGGIGKTQLAVDFARRHQATFSSILWLDGRSEDRLRQSLASCANRIPEGQIPDRSRKVDVIGEGDLHIIVEDVLTWLGRPGNTEWLLIFDNVDLDYEHDQVAGAYDPRRYLPGDHGSILITTRLARFAQLGESKRLGKADTAFSKAIFEKWRGQPLENDEAACELLELLDGLPLALAQAASYLCETQLNTQSYLRLYKQQWKDFMMPETDSDSPLIDYEHRSVGTTWAISFQMIESRNEKAANLLRLWALLDNRDLWHGLLQGIQTDEEEEWPVWLRQLSCNETEFLDAARLLLRYSLIESQESELDSYSMHPVVHNWVLFKQDALTRQVFLRLAVMVVGCSAPQKSHKEYRMLQRRLSPHAERCVWLMENIFDMEWTKFAKGSFLECLRKVIRFFSNQERLKEAARLCRQALEGREQGLASDDTPTLGLLHGLGIIYAKQRQLEEVEIIFQRVLEGLEKKPRPDNLRILSVIRDIANVYRRQGRLEEAEIMYQRALEGNEKELGPDHTRTLNTVHNLAILYRDQGRLEEAEIWYQRALKGKEKGLGSDHPSTLDTVHSLSILYRKQGRLGEAEVMCQRALEGQEKDLGTDHPSTLDTVHSLSILYRKQGRLGEAEMMCKRALKGQEKYLGPYNPSTLDTVHELAIVHDNQGRLGEAEMLYQRAIQGMEKHLGSDHKSTLRTVKNLGAMYHHYGCLEEAQTMYRRALAGYSKMYGSDHPKVHKIREMLDKVDAKCRTKQMFEASEEAFALSSRGDAKRPRQAQVRYKDIMLPRTRELLPS